VPSVHNSYSLVSEGCEFVRELGLQDCNAVIIAINTNSIMSYLLDKGLCALWELSSIAVLVFPLRVVAMALWLHAVTLSVNFVQDVRKQHSANSLIAGCRNTCQHRPRHE
jgi:hypothetical protein